MRTAIILPAYNVEIQIIDVLKKLQPYQRRTIIVDGGSTDHTVDCVHKYQFYCISQQKNMGLSKALLMGLKTAKEAGYDSAIILDSDGQHNPERIPEFEAALQKSDIVTGNRFHSFRNLPSNKIASNAMGAAILREVFQSDFFDTSCGYKGILLDDDVLQVAEASESYSFVFDILLDSLNKKKVISSLKIECIYPPSEFHYTKRQEIMSFITSFRKYTTKELFLKSGLIELENHIKISKDFIFEIQDLSFYGFYLKEYDGYILQTDQKALYRWVSNNMKNVNNICG